LKQFILKETPGRDRLVRLDGDDYHYLVRVRRLKPGDSFPVLLPERISGTVTVLSTEGGILSGRVSATLSTHPDLPAGLAQPALPPVILFQALLKGAKIDLIVRQAAESALREVVVFTAERSVVRPGTPGGPGKEERWRRIVKEARQQSGSVTETAVRFCPSLDAALSYWAALKEKCRKAPGLLLHQDPLASALSAKDPDTNRIPRTAG
jgi:16S rRNA (uracil1498-N3)-methyltransferase